MCSNTPAQIVSCSSVIMGPLLSRPLGLVECNNYFSGDVLKMVLESTKLGNIFEKVSADIRSPLSITSERLTGTQPPSLDTMAYVSPEASTMAGRLSQLKYVDIGSSAINISNSVALR